MEGRAGEPDWPKLAEWRTQRRRSIRIGGGPVTTEEETPQCSEFYVDEHTLGAMVSHLIRLTIGELPYWIVPLTEHLMKWTGDANGPHGERSSERDNRPYTWNSHFFE